MDLLRVLILNLIIIKLNDIEIVNYLFIINL